MISINAELLLTIESKKEWINKVPKCLPEKSTSAEEWIWIDKNGEFINDWRRFHSS